MIAVDLHPRGPFHVGELGVGREETLSYVPSDTLYAALVSAWVALGDQGPFDSSPLRLTSAFPRVGALRLYPRPFVRIPAAQEQRDELGKTLSKFEWCSERIFALLVRGADMTTLAVEPNFVFGVWFHPDDKPPADAKFWATKPPVPHVAIDRLDNAPNLFHSGRVTFGPGCGLWFGVEYDAPDAALCLERALGYLADAGLGGLRSTGHGGFDFAVQEAVAPVSQTSSGYAVTLSRYLPASPAEIASALKAEHAAYKLVRVGGWCHDDAGQAWRRKQIRMAREGSVLGWNGGALGRIADLKPDGVGQFGDRPVLRYGLAFPIPVAKEALL
jgi:CRISPR-associated protein Csm4